MNCIGLDLGTSAIKGVLTVSDAVRAMQSSEVVLRRTPETVDIEPLGYAEQVLALIRALAAQAPGPVAALAIAAASGNTLVTSADGTPRSAIISWLDPRTCAPPDERVHEIIGWPFVGNFPYAHLFHLKLDQPEIFDGSEQVGMNNDWVQFLLCGRRALDFSSATPFYLQDQCRHCWHQPYLDRLGLRHDSLPELVPSGQVIGTLRPALAGGNLHPDTLIVSGCFDHPAAARAANIQNPDEMLISCGTSWVAFRATPERSLRPGTLADPYLSDSGGPWGEIVSLPRVGQEIEHWVQTHVGSGPDRYQNMNTEALAGGPARQMILEIMHRFRQRLGATGGFRRLVMVGGPTESPAWSQAAETVFGTPIDPSPHAKNAGAVGAAGLARAGAHAHAAGAHHALSHRH